MGSEESYFLILNYGDFQNHCHYDQLDFEIYANGIPIALDAGIGKLGYLDSLHVSWYKHPLSHNMLTINQAVPEKMDKPGYDKVWSPQQQTEFFAATHDGYLRYQKAKHRRHIVFAKRRYWLVIDEVSTAGKNQEMEFNFHTPCSMTAIEDGFISTGENGFLIKQDRRDAANISRTRSQGGANLGGLQNEPTHREIDWLVFSKALKGDRRSDRMATLIYPFASTGGIVPADVSVERVDLKDDAAVGYRVRTKDREDLDHPLRREVPEIHGEDRRGFHVRPHQLCRRRRRLRGIHGGLQVQDRRGDGSIVPSQKGLRIPEIVLDGYAGPDESTANFTGSPMRYEFPYDTIAPVDIPAIPSG